VSWPYHAFECSYRYLEGGRELHSVATGFGVSFRYGRVATDTLTALTSIPGLRMSTRQAIDAEHCDVRAGSTVFPLQPRVHARFERRLDAVPRELA
jgi:hypothetical protein